MSPRGFALRRYIAGNPDLWADPAAQLPPGLGNIIPDPNSYSQAINNHTGKVDPSFWQNWNDDKAKSYSDYLVSQAQPSGIRDRQLFSKSFNRTQDIGLVDRMNLK